MNKIINLSISIIYKMLSEQIYVTKNTETYEDNPIKNIVLWNRKKTSSQALYILKLEELEEAYQELKGCSLLCIGKTNDKIITEGCDIIFTRDDIKIIDVCNKVFEIYQKFMDWKEIIYELDDSIPNLTYLLDTSKNFFNIQFIIIDNQYNYVGFSQGYLEYNEKWTGRGNSGVLDIVNDLNSNMEFTKTFDEKGIFISPNYNKDDILFGYNIFYQNKYEARLLANVPLKADYQGDKKIIEYLGNIVTEVYKNYHEKCIEDESHNVFKDLLKQLISGENVEKNKTENIFLLNEWNINDRYCVIKFFLHGRESAGLSKGFLGMQIEKIFEGCCVVQYENEIICVRNITKCKNPKKFREILPYFLRDSICKAGINNEFNNIYDLYSYCIQARTALSIGERVKETFWYYRFSEFSRIYIKEQCLKDYDAVQICHPALLKLIENDKRENTNLYETLRVFIKCKFNSSRAANELFIHRSTLIHRVQKIERLVEIDYDDWDEILFLMLSYSLMEMRSEIKSIKKY